MAVVIPYIPENIVVHLGPPDSDAANVTVSFPDYIKNVASSEIYPTWNDSALLANIYAQISFALNRVYTEYYRSRGYNFSITNSTATDQKFIQGRNIFENIDRIVDEVFNSYIRRQNTLEPLFAQFCNGTTTTCDGLSQWGSQELAEQGYNSIQILRNYYGDDIEIVTNAPVMGIVESYPGTPIRQNDANIYVQVIQTMLNRISQNYPAIPKINPVNGIFDENTLNSAKKFQSIFNLSSDGVVGNATWYKMVFLYVGITKLSELESEGQRIYGSSIYPEITPTVAAANMVQSVRTQVHEKTISEGDEGKRVTLIQYYLAVVAAFNDEIPPIAITGEYGEETTNAVIAFQRSVNLPQTGEVDSETFDMLYRQYYGNSTTVLGDDEFFPISTVPYGGKVLYLGSTGEDVRVLQEYLNEINSVTNGIKPIGVTGTFGRQTLQAVIAYQRGFGLPVTGRVNQETWNSIANTYKNVMSALTTTVTQYPGYEMKLGDADKPVNF